MQQIRDEYRQALQRLHYETYTDVQKLVIPSAMEGKDVFVHAPAGSGKTLAYVLPILNSLTLQGKGKHMPKALILCPTRELCMQVASLIRSILLHIEGYRTIVLTGGVDIKAQIRAFRNGGDIVVGTPSRITDHIRRHTLKMEAITTLVLDEADEMLEELIDRFGDPPKSVQNLLLIARLKCRAHGIFIKEITQKGSELKLVMYEKAEIDPLAIPRFVDSFAPFMQFTMDAENPYFVYRLGGNSREKNRDILEVLGDLLTAMETLLAQEVEKT